MTDAHKKANAKWQKENVTRITIKLYKNTDADLIDFIGKTDNVQGTIKQILRDHISKGSK